MSLMTGSHTTKKKARDSVHRHCTRTVDYDHQLQRYDSRLKYVTFSQNNTLKIINMSFEFFNDHNCINNKLWLSSGYHVHDVTPSVIKGYCIDVTAIIVTILTLRLLTLSWLLHQRYAYKRYHGDIWRYQTVDAFVIDALQFCSVGDNIMIAVSSLVSNSDTWKLNSDSW